MNYIAPSPAAPTQAIPARFTIRKPDNRILVTPRCAIVIRRGSRRQLFYTRLTLASFMRFLRLLDACEPVADKVFAYRGQ